MLKFSLVLHFYQPPTQSLNLTEEILRSCYLPLCDLLLEKDNARVTLNISGSLLLQTQAIQGHELSLKLRRLADSGKVDFLNSPVYHPISPLTNTEVLDRQLSETEKVLENFCGIKAFVGIFPPELAIDEITYHSFRKHSGFVLVDESSLNPTFQIGNVQSKDFTNSRTLTEIIRSYPFELDAKRFASFVQNNLSQEDSLPIICATDAEVFGHHYRERINFLRDLFDQKAFEFCKLSDFIPSNPPPITPVASTWQTTSENLEANNPFPYWKSPTNALQHKYYELANKASAILSETKSESIPSHMLHSAQSHFDQGISSCHPYWLSNLPWWHPDLAEKGAQQLMKCIRTVPTNPKVKQECESFYHQFLEFMWHHHWSGEIEKRYVEHDQNRSKFLESLPKL